MTENMNENIINTADTMGNNADMGTAPEAIPVVPVVEETTAPVPQPAVEPIAQPQPTIQAAPQPQPAPQYGQPQAAPQPQPAPQYGQPQATPQPQPAPQPQAQYTQRTTPQYSQPQQTVRNYNAPQQAVPPQPAPQKPCKQKNQNKGLWFRIVMTALLGIITILLVINTVFIVKFGKEVQRVKNAIESIEIPNFIDIFDYDHGYDSPYNYDYNYGNDDDFFSRIFGDGEDWYYEDSYGDSYGDRYENQGNNSNRQDNGQKDGDGFSFDDIYNFFSGIFGEDGSSQGA